MHSVRFVEKPSDDYMDRMTDLLHECFSYSYFGGGLGTRELSRELLKHHIKAALVDPAGEVWVAEDDSSETRALIGVAVWFGPGAVYLATPEQRSIGWDEIYVRLDAEKQAWWDYFLREYDGMSATSLGEGVKPGGYHLQVIGVLRERRKQGVARSLFKVIEEKAKQRSVCTCLETIGNGAVPVYRALGYEVKGPVELKSPRDPNVTMPMYAFVKVFG